MSNEPSTECFHSVVPISSGERYSVPVTTRVPHTLRAWLEQSAAAQGLSVSAYVRHELYLLRSRSPREQ